MGSFRFGANGFSRDVLPESYATNGGAAWGVKWLNAYRHFNDTAMELIAWRG